MRHAIRWSILSTFVLSLSLACEKQETSPEPTEGMPAEAPKATGDGVTGADEGRAAAPATKLSLETITASEEGFLVNSTLVTGEREAVLIDAQFTLEGGKKVADEIADSKKTLTTVYVTHEHPDHYFGFPAIKERFPNAKFVALPKTVEEIQKTWQAKVKEWQPQYKDKITSEPVIPEPLVGSSIELEGQKLEIVGAQQGDSENNSYVWIPSLRAVVTGDIAYDEVFPWTAETTPESRKAWATTLERVQALKPAIVVPGHQKKDGTRDTQSLTFTKEYLAAFDQALSASKSPAELQAKLKEKYPDAALEVIAKIGAEAAFKKPAQKPEVKTDLAAEPKTDVAAEPKAEQKTP